MKAVLISTVIVLSLSGLAAAEDAKSPLTGTWDMMTAKAMGRDTKSPLIRTRMVFADADKVTIQYDTTNQGGNERTVTGKYTYDPDSKPARIVLKDFPSAIPTTLIAKLDGNELTICYDGKGGQVPDDFKTTEADDREIVYFAKQKE